MPTRRKRRARPVAGDRRPITEAACWRNFVLPCLLLAFVAAYVPRLHNPLSGISILVFCALLLNQQVRWYRLLRRIRAGETWELVYEAPSLQESVRAARHEKEFGIFAICLGCFTSIIPLLLTIASGLMPPGSLFLLFPTLGSLLIGAGSYRRISADRISRKPVARLRLSSPLSVVHSEQAIAVPSLAAEGTTGPPKRHARHWWTDTQLREDVTLTTNRR